MDDAPLWAMLTACFTIGNLDVGEYSYYYQDENSNWIKKEEIGSCYFLYGQLMAGNFSYDMQNGCTGLTFECWNFTMDRNNMVWTGLRENNITFTYEMVKVDLPPETL